MEFLNNDQLAFIFGLLGNIVSFMVFLAPLPTFYTIYKKKSSKGFQSIPYVVALLSATLLLYYGVLKTNANLIISINGIGCVIEITYLIFFIIYASKKDKVATLSMILLLNVVGIGLVMVVTVFFLNGTKRVSAIGWICAVFNIAVFAAPLSIMRQVIRTKNVEYMPFSLSLFLTLCATMWFFYGIFTKDYYIALPNVLGFLFGIAQMILYITYKNSGKDEGKEDSPSQEMKKFMSSTNRPKLMRSVSCDTRTDKLMQSTFVCNKQLHESNDNRV